jgi:tetratricopeptide (TPR) repeat protein
MARESGSRPIRGFVAATIFGIGLCTTAPGQEAASEPPALTPLPPPELAAPPKVTGTSTSKDAAIERPSTILLADPVDVAVDPLTGATPRRPPRPDQIRPFLPFFTDVPALPGKATTDHPKKEPGPADARLARIGSKLEENGRRLFYLDAEILRHPDRAAGYFQRGCFRAQAAEEGDEAALAAAAADFSRALELEPGHPYARLWRGYVADRRGNRAAAIADFTWVIEHDPLIGEALVYRGKVLLNQGEIDRAIADFDRADGHADADRSQIWIYRGCCYYAAGRHDRAIADFSKAVDESLASIWVLAKRAESYQTIGDLDRALSDIGTVIGLEPYDASALFLRITILAEKGQYLAAARDANRLKQLMPTEPGPYFLRAVTALSAAHQRDETLAGVDLVAAQVARIAPSATLPRIIRAAVTCVAGLDRKDALADLDRCFELRPRLSYLYACGVVINAHEGRLVPTLRELARFLVTFRPGNYRLYASIDRDRHRFTIGFWEILPESEVTPRADRRSAAIGAKCISSVWQQFLAGSLGFERYTAVTVDGRGRVAQLSGGDSAIRYNGPHERHHHRL